MNRVAKMFKSALKIYTYAFLYTVSRNPNLCEQNIAKFYRKKNKRELAGPKTYIKVRLNTFKK